MLSYFLTPSFIFQTLWKIACFRRIYFTCLICFFAYAKNLQRERCIAEMGPAEMLPFFTVVRTTFSIPEFLSWDSAVSVTSTSHTADTILVDKYFLPDSHDRSWAGVPQYLMYSANCLYFSMHGLPFVSFGLVLSPEQEGSSGKPTAC